MAYLSLFGRRAALSLFMDRRTLSPWAFGGNNRGLEAVLLDSSPAVAVLSRRNP